MNPFQIPALTYETFFPVVMVLDFFYVGVKRAAERKDRRTLAFLRENVHDWWESINNLRLNYDDPNVTPVIMGNLNRAYGEVGNLLKVIELRLASVKR